jgi:putative ABC transport system permease protein
MYKHLFKLIWNKKKQNFLLMSEMLVSFLVIFAVFTLLVNYYTNYRKPMGLNDQRVLVASYSKSVDMKDKDSLRMFFNVLRNTLESMPEVEYISLTGNNTPFSSNTFQGAVDFGKLHLNSINQYRTDFNYTKVLGMEVLEGRWFGKQDVASTYKPVIINNSLRVALFGQQRAIGQVIGSDSEKKMKVIGVVADIKDKGDYTVPKKGMYYNIDTGSLGGIQRLMIKVAPNADAGFETRLYRNISSYLKDPNIDIEHLGDKRKTMNSSDLVPMIILLVVSSFLIINVALGIFGVLWYNINKRRGEIGLRRAIGASGAAVSRQIVTESLLLATMSLIVGSFFAIQFPLLNVFDLPTTVYVIALIAAIMFIYLLVFLCSVYPGRQAAQVYPAVALHED